MPGPAANQNSAAPSQQQPSQRQYHSQSHHTHDQSYDQVRGASYASAGSSAAQASARPAAAANFYQTAPLATNAVPAPAINTGQYYVQQAVPRPVVQQQFDARQAVQQTLVQMLAQALATHSPDPAAQPSFIDHLIAHTLVNYIGVDNLWSSHDLPGELADIAHTAVQHAHGQNGLLLENHVTAHQGQTVSFLSFVYNFTPRDCHVQALAVLEAQPYNQNGYTMLNFLGAVHLASIGYRNETRLYFSLDLPSGDYLLGVFFSGIHQDMQCSAVVRCGNVDPYGRPHFLRILDEYYKQDPYRSTGSKMPPAVGDGSDYNCGRGTSSGYGGSSHSSGGSSGSGFEKYQGSSSYDGIYYNGVYYYTPDLPGYSWLKLKTRTVTLADFDKERKQLMESDHGSMFVIDMLASIILANGLLEDGEHTRDILRFSARFCDAFGYSILMHLAVREFGYLVDPLIASLSNEELCKQLLHLDFQGKSAEQHAKEAENTALAERLHELRVNLCKDTVPKAQDLLPYDTRIYRVIAFFDEVKQQGRLAAPAVIIETVPAPLPASAASSIPYILVEHGTDTHEGDPKSIVSVGSIDVSFGSVGSDRSFQDIPEVRSDHSFVSIGSDSSSTGRYQFSNSEVVTISRESSSASYPAYGGTYAFRAAKWQNPKN